MGLASPLWGLPSPARGDAVLHGGSFQGSPPARSRSRAGGRITRPVRLKIYSERARCLPGRTFQHHPGRRVPRSSTADASKQAVAESREQVSRAGQTSTAPAAVSSSRLMPPLSRPMHGTPAFWQACTSQTVSPTNTASPAGTRPSPAPPRPDPGRACWIRLPRRRWPRRSRLRRPGRHAGR